MLPVELRANPEHALTAENILQTEFPSQGFQKLHLGFHRNGRTDLSKIFG